MDKSIRYIEMCKVASEIQELKFVREWTGDGVTWKDYRFDKGDYYAHYNDVRYNDAEYLRSENDSPYGLTPHLVWLPTFEQYLTIYMNHSKIASESKALLYLADYLTDDFSRDPRGDLNVYDTKERLALAWIMRVCYNKWWDDSKWVQYGDYLCEEE